MKTTPYVTSAPADRNVRPKKSSALGRPGERHVVRDDVREREGDVQRAERDDERRQPDQRDEAAVQHAEADAGQDPEQERRQRRDAAGDRQLRHHDLPERHHRPDREVDAGGQDDERLADREHADDHRLLQDEREVLASAGSGPT